MKITKKELKQYLIKTENFKKSLYGSYNQLLKNKTIDQNTLFNSFILKFNVDTDKVEWKNLLDKLNNNLIDKHNLIFDEFTLVWTIEPRFSMTTLYPQIGQASSNVLDTNMTSAIDSISQKFNLYINDLLENDYKIALFENTILFKDPQTENYKFLFGELFLNEPQEN
ncbi:MSC_0623 family F1-like ATPase-associated protein [Mycoplasmopsis iners]|uniref:MSC_0623 family F1-like ATPase-associated protein n=1 Tax=Mycoplasmopsis iners TaxID=76630 RepID=UPI000495F398|nr:DUF2714 domain-containing protein [Mycoplasmopsis iners]